MKKILILLSMLGFIIASQAQEIRSIKDLSTNKDIFLMFSIPSCPWCIRQLEVLEDIQEERELEVVKVEDGSQIHKELVSKYPFPVDYYPTSFIVTKEGDELDIEYEFHGYQKKSSIIKVLDSKDDF